MTARKKYVFRWWPNYGGGIEIVKAEDEDSAWDAAIGVDNWREKEEDIGKELWSGKRELIGTWEEFEEDVDTLLDDGPAVKVTYGYQE